MTDFVKHFVQLTEQQIPKDVFVPSFWSDLRNSDVLRPDDIYRIRSHDGVCDFCVSIEALVKDGAKVEMWPRSAGALRQ